MPHLALAALEGILRPHVALSKSRLETLCLLIVGMVSARTVNLAHIACERPGPAQTASTYRRLQRFFQHVRLDRDWALPLVARLVGSDRRWTLVLDRTNWSNGAREVNYLVLAIVTRRFRVPLAWTVLPGKGNSSTAARIALIKRYLAHFPASTIDLLLADREFIGADWLKFLNNNNIPFVIRLREHLRVVTEDGCELTLSARLRGTRKTRGFRARLWAQNPEDAIWFNFAVKRLKGEWLIVASSLPPRRALAAYRRRWAIECMFADLKTRGLNLEDTGLTDPRKLDLLMAIVALALAWAGRAACDLLGRGEPKRKAHGHLAKSWFRTGLERVRNLLRSQPPTAIAPWRILTRKPPKSWGVV
jgi:Transposase DDE domain